MQDFGEAVASLTVKPFADWIKRYWWIFAVFAAVIGLWALAWYAIVRFIPSNPNAGRFSDRGQFGDMFGAVNALFAGLAFAGVICTLWLQRKELEQTQDQIKNTGKPSISAIIGLERQPSQGNIVVTNSSQQRFKELSLVAVVCGAFDGNKNTLLEAECKTLNYVLAEQFEPRDSLTINPFRDFDGHLIRPSNVFLQADNMKRLNPANVRAAFVVVLRLKRMYDERTFFKFVLFQAGFTTEGTEFEFILPLNALRGIATYSYGTASGLGQTGDPITVRCRNLMSEFCKGILDDLPPFTGPIGLRVRER